MTCFYCSASHCFFTTVIVNRHLVQLSMQLQFITYRKLQFSTDKNDIQAIELLKLLITPPTNWEFSSISCISLYSTWYEQVKIYTKSSLCTYRVYCTN